MNRGWVLRLALAPAAAAMLGVLSATCAGATVDPCEGEDCSNRGSCFAVGLDPFCVCHAGYHPDGLECLANDPDDPCAGVGCAGHGTCRVAGTDPTCDCFPGYVHLSVVDPDCTDLACDLVCVEEPERDAGVD
ncbi:MAG: hypothetical protein JXB32_21780 [Deltaproteobacteria bacterium]|nr:hypothetical protein [Deltaproteobacteria bacterium]